MVQAKRTISSDWLVHNQRERKGRVVGCSGSSNSGAAAERKFSWVGEMRRYEFLCMKVLQGVSDLASHFFFIKKQQQQKQKHSLTIEQRSSLVSAPSSCPGFLGWWTVTVSRNKPFFLQVASDHSVYHSNREQSRTQGLSSRPRPASSRLTPPRWTLSLSVFI